LGAASSDGEGQRPQALLDKVTRVVVHVVEGQRRSVEDAQGKVADALDELGVIELDDRGTDARDACAGRLRHRALHHVPQGVELGGRVADLPPQSGVVPRSRRPTRDGLRHRDESIQLAPASSRSRTARLRSEAGSEPAAGSETPWQQTSSPLSMAAKWRARRSSVAWAIRVRPAWRRPTKLTPTLGATGLVISS